VLSAVTPGLDFGNEIEIVAGLKTDDRVIINSQTPSSPGRKSKCSGNIAGRYQVKRSRKMSLAVILRRAPRLAVLLAIAALQLSGCEVGSNQTLQGRVHELS
jgi:hypothetical protein